MCSQWRTFRCVLNGGGDSTGAGCGASPPASGGRPGVFSCAGQGGTVGGAEGGRGGQGGLVWNTPALAHMVSPLFMVVMSIWFLFIKYRFDNLSLVPFFSGGTACW